MSLSPLHCTSITRPWHCRTPLLVVPFPFAAMNINFWMTCHSCQHKGEFHSATALSYGDIKKLHCIFPCSSHVKKMQKKQKAHLKCTLLAQLWLWSTFTRQHSRQIYCCDCKCGALIKNSSGYPRLDVVCRLNAVKHSRSSKPCINRRLFALTYQGPKGSWGSVVLCLCFKTITPGVRHVASLGHTFYFNVNVRLIHLEQRLPVDKLVAFPVLFIPYTTMATNYMERLIGMKWRLSTDDGKRIQ